MCLVVLPGFTSLLFAQTRPLVDPAVQAEAQAQEEARALAAARAWRIEPSIGSTVTATSNSGLSFGPDPAKDLIVDVEPRVIIHGRGASFTLEGNLGLKQLVFVNSTQENRVLPTGTIALNANLVERWLYFDLSALAEQVAADPYTTRADSDSSVNKINSFQYRVSPYLQHRFTPDFSLTARNDNIWTRRRGEFNLNDARRNSLFNKDSLLLEQLPRPLGFSLEGSQQTTKYLTGVETILKNGSARAIVTYAVDPTFTVGLVGGKEKSEYALSTTSDTISGARVTWVPTERTELKGSYEKRFFGNGGSLQFSHRSPFIALTLNASREPSALGTSFLLNPGAGDTRTLLDAIFTTRYPNPADRAAIVNGVIAGLGAPSVLGNPLEVFADYAQLRDSASASVVFQGVRSTVITRVFAVRSRQLIDPNAPFVPVLGVQADHTQKGLSVDFNRRLTRTLSMEVGLGYSSIEGLGIASGQITKNGTARLGLSQDMSPKTRATVGARYQKASVVAPGQAGTANETAAFVGMVHRF